MIYNEPFKTRFGWVITTADSGFFEDCRINRLKLTTIHVERGDYPRDTLEGVLEFNKISPTQINLPTPKGACVSDQQQLMLKFIGQNRSSFEENCKRYLDSLRAKSNPLFSPQLEITQCLELSFMIVPYGPAGEVRIYFDCDWGKFDCIGIRYLDSGKIEECDLEVDKYFVDSK